MCCQKLNLFFCFLIFSLVVFFLKCYEILTFFCHILWMHVMIISNDLLLGWNNFPKLIKFTHNHEVAYWVSLQIQKEHEDSIMTSTCTLQQKQKMEIPHVCECWWCTKLKIQLFSYKCFVKNVQWSSQNKLTNTYNKKNVWLQFIKIENNNKPNGLKYNISIFKTICKW